MEEAQQQQQQQQQHFLEPASSPELVFGVAVAGMFGLGLLTAAVVSVVVAPYGRHVRRGWGPLMSVRDGWVIMESPALWFFVAVFMAGQHSSETVPIVLLRMFQVGLHTL